MATYMPLFSTRSGARHNVKAVIIGLTILFVFILAIVSITPRKERGAADLSLGEAGEIVKEPIKQVSPKPTVPSDAPKPSLNVEKVVHTLEPPESQRPTVVEETLGSVNEPPKEDQGALEDVKNFQDTADEHGHMHHNDDDEEEPMDHEAMHGEPGVAMPVEGVFGEGLEAEKGRLAEIRFMVDQGLKPNIFIAQPEFQTLEMPAFDDSSLIAVLTRAFRDSIEAEETPSAQYLSFACHCSKPGYARAALLAAVRGASTISCVLPPDQADHLTPILTMSARLNLVDDKFQFHPSNIFTNSSLSLDTIAIVREIPIGVMHISSLPTPIIVDLLLRSPKTLSLKLRYIIVDLPTTSPLNGTEMVSFLDHMHTAGYDFHILPSHVGSGITTYIHTATASYLGSEYAADHLNTKFIYIPKADYSLVKDVFEDGGEGGKVRVWWVRRDDKGVRKLMATRHHVH